MIELLDTKIKEINDTIKEKTSRLTDPKKKIELHIDIILEFLDREKEVLQILHAEQSCFDPETSNRLREKVRKIYYEHYIEVYQIIKQGIKENIFKDINADVLTISLIGMIQGFLLHYIIASTKYNILEMAPQIKSIFFEGTAR